MCVYVCVHVRVCMYVCIYKSWVLGVLNKYMTRVLSHPKFATDKSQA